MPAPTAPPDFIEAARRLGAEHRIFIRHGGAPAQLMLFAAQAEKLLQRMGAENWTVDPEVADILVKASSLGTRMLDCLAQGPH